MAKADTAAKDHALHAIAAAIERDSVRLLEANRRDLDAARAKGLAPAMVDRLALTQKGVAAMAEGLRQIAQLPDPVGEISDLKYRPSGIQVGRMRVPLGVVAIIYEARPNVTADAAGLCLKSGNASILRGGSEAIHCNQAIAECVHEGLRAADLPQTAVQVIEVTDRAAVGELITMKEYVDIIVPRGGKGLIAHKLQSDARIIASFPVKDEEELLLVTDKGQLIRTGISDIRIAGRATQGVILISVAEDEHVVAAERLEALSGENGEAEEGGEGK